MSVYFIYDGRGHVKIGHSSNVKARVAALQTATALRLNLLGWLPGGVEEEHLLHETFQADRVVGEWFKYGRDLESFGKFLVADWRHGMTVGEAVDEWIDLCVLEDKYPILFDRHEWAHSVQAG